jgi:Fe-S-cluster containining protein
MDPFKCKRCGLCCHYPPPPAPGDVPVEKKISVYPEEARVLERIAGEQGVQLRLLEDLVMPDVQNKHILVGRYQILPDERNACPFYAEDPAPAIPGKHLARCTIHAERPLACRAYPLAVRRLDSFTQKFFIDPDCPAIQAQLTAFKGIKPDEVTMAFPTEKAWAQKQDAREQAAFLEVRCLVQQGKARIPENFPNAEYEAALRDWDRADIEP